MATAVNRGRGHNEVVMLSKQMRCKAGREKCKPSSVVLQCRSLFTVASDDTETKEGTGKWPSYLVSGR